MRYGKSLMLYEQLNNDSDILYTGKHLHLKSQTDLHTYSYGVSITFQSKEDGSTFDETLDIISLTFGVKVLEFMRMRIPTIGKYSVQSSHYTYSFLHQEPCSVALATVDSERIGPIRGKRQ
jgi:hypothetical protein